jgi:hypothetical protein
MKNGGKVCVSDIKENDEICGGGRVSGVIRLKGEDIPVIRLGHATCVTRDHIIQKLFEGWCTVEDLCSINEEKTDEVICLVTENNLIISDGFVFRDFEEVTDCEMQCKISNLIMRNLGRKEVNLQSVFELGEKNNCLPCNTKVKMEDATFREISKVQIGDKISTGTVIGKYSCDTTGIKWVKIKDTIISPRLICSVDNHVNVKGYEIGTIVNDEIKIGYHLITTSHEIELNDCTVRDFIETDDDEVQRRISQLVLEHLNS